jgi:hypothetical protein
MCTRLNSRRLNVPEPVKRVLHFNLKFMQKLTINGRTKTLSGSTYCKRAKEKLEKEAEEIKKTKKIDKFFGPQIKQTQVRDQGDGK